MLTSTVWLAGKRGCVSLAEFPKVTETTNGVVCSLPASKLLRANFKETVPETGAELCRASTYIQGEHTFTARFTLHVRQYVCVSLDDPTTETVSISLRNDNVSIRFCDLYFDQRNNHGKSLTRLDFILITFTITRVDFSLFFFL